MLAVLWPITKDRFIIRQFLLFHLLRGAVQGFIFPDTRVKRIFCGRERREERKCVALLNVVVRYKKMICAVSSISFLFNQLRKNIFFPFFLYIYILNNSQYLSNWKFLFSFFSSFRQLFLWKKHFRNTDSRFNNRK